MFWLVANFAYFCTLKKGKNQFNHSISKNMITADQLKNVLEREQALRGYL
jgi:hypothetical protein